MANNTLSFTYNNNTTTISLPDLFWEDEYQWFPVGQTHEYSLTGDLIVEESVKQNGRTISLVGSENLGWIDKSVLDALTASATIPNLKMTLTLANNQSFTVRWDLSKEKAIEATKVFRTFPHDDTGQDYWSVSLYFFEDNS